MPAETDFQDMAASNVSSKKAIDEKGTVENQGTALQLGARAPWAHPTPPVSCDEAW